MSDAPVTSPPSREPPASNPVQAGAPLSITPQQLTEAVAAAHEVLRGARVERVLELSGPLTIAKLVLESVLKGELVIARPTSPTPAPNEKGAQPKPGQRPRLRRA